MHKSLLATVAAVALTFALSAEAVAADLPKTTQKVLRELKLDPALMGGGLPDDRFYLG